MSEFPLEPSSSTNALPIPQALPKREEEADLEKFETEMKKIKTDAEQKKQRKREEEDNEESKKIVQDAQELITKQEESLYAVQKPNIKSIIKKKKIG